MENGHRNPEKKKTNKRKHQTKEKEDVEGTAPRKEGPMIHR
jgi:hypothetical protein